MDILMGFLIQLASSVGVIFLFGSLIALLRRAFCNLTGRDGPKILLATGIIGTPIHELSHALMCLIFGHKIAEIKLYQPKSEDGTLGYVSHTYSKRNIYHQIGNFFIGTAPVIIGGAVLILFMLLFVPDTFNVFVTELDLLNSSNVTLGDYFSFTVSAITAIFSKENITSWQGVVFIILALMITTHMEMSGADIKSGLKGLAYISVLLLVVDIVIYLISPEAFESINETALSFGLLFSAFLTISLLFLLALVAVALIIRGIVGMFGR